MANKLYEEESIRAIADKIRKFTNNKSATYTVDQMANGIEGACQTQCENGRDAGFGEGAAYVKTTEARTSTDIIGDVDVLGKQVSVDVTPGYYAEEINVNFDAVDIYDEGYDAGFIAGRNGGSSEDLEALGALCDWQITTDSASMPILTICNYHPTYYLHCHVWASNSNVDDDFVVAPDDCVSVEFLDEVFSLIQPIYVNSVRWSADA